MCILQIVFVETVITSSSFLLIQLKKKEAEHIARITEEWTSQTKAQNTELDNKMAECKGLAETLSNAKQDLRERLKSCAMREQGVCITFVIDD